LIDKVGRESKKQDDGSKLSQILRKRELTKQEELEYAKRKPKYESDNDDVNEVALRIAETFPYHEISVAYDPKKAPHIHGWLQDKYRNFQWLIDNYVMEVAAWYSRNKLEHKVDIIKVVEGIPLKEYKTARVELPKFYRLENYPEQPFVNILFMCEEHLDDVIYWLEDSEWMIDGEDVRVNLGRFGGELIAWITWNIPVILITYLPFRNKGIFKAKMQSQEIKDLVIDKRLKLIHTYRTMIDTLEAKVDEKAREAKQWKKMYDDFKKDVDLEARKALARASYTSGNKRTIRRTYNFNIILVILCVILLIVCIVGWLN
jgi:hypothetical protein